MCAHIQFVCVCRYSAVFNAYIFGLAKVSLPSVHFYRVKRSIAWYCCDKLCIHLSVRLFVTLVDCDTTCSNFLKIISPMISLTFLLSAHPNITALLQSKVLRESGIIPRDFRGIGITFS